jgi:small nuclear ribonucleoprotein (snRNP)-like protein
LPRKDRLIRAHLSERFVVTLDDGQTFLGLLRDIDDRVLVLVDASQLADNGDVLAVDGALYIERIRINYMQRP